MREVLYFLRKQFPMPQLLLLGPSVAPFSKISSYYRYHLIFKAQTVKILQNAIRLFNSFIIALPISESRLILFNT